MLSERCLNAVELWDPSAVHQKCLRSKWQKKTVQLYGQPYWEVDKNGKPIKTGLAVKDPSKGAAFYIKPGTGGVLGRTLLSTRRTNQLKSSKTL